MQPTKVTCCLFDRWCTDHIQACLAIANSQSFAAKLSNEDKWPVLGDDVATNELGLGHLKWHLQQADFELAMAPELWVLADCVQTVEVVDLQGNKNNSLPSNIHSNSASFRLRRCRNLIWTKDLPAGGWTAFLRATFRGVFRRKPSRSRSLQT